MARDSVEGLAAAEQDARRKAAKENLLFRIMRDESRTLPFQQS